MKELLRQLTDQGLLGADAVERICAMHRGGALLDDALLEHAGAGEEQARLLRAMAAEFDMPFVDLQGHRPQPEFLARFPARILLKYRLLPLEPQNGSMLVATSRAFDSTGLDELRLATGTPCRPALAAPEDLERCIKQALGVGADTVQTLVAETQHDGIEVLTSDDAEDVDLADVAQDASIIKFVNQILAEAIERRATDVHIEPFENHLRVRYRVDGMLQEANIPAQTLQLHAAIVSRLKIISNLDIAEKRLPQDGRIKLRIRSREIDVRVSVIPMLHAEAIVLRLLDRDTPLLGLGRLGLSPASRKQFERVLGLPHGIILVTGPTGSGKTTTLYAALAQINDVERKIITIEDPIEYHLAGINQIQVSTKTGLTFASGLRSILRHDPDVILIGEIRDQDTAQIAVQASLTGHLVFSTLHTNDAPGALTRLIDMGVEPYLVTSSLELVLAQRLIRLICESCRERIVVDEAAGLREQFGVDLPDALYHGRGCSACRGTGYYGRMGIFEMMPMNESI
ncbi:MAG: GspE/PulE family protein, partial [Pirellulaceae bacterium]|nr:GspE/PulE family protein [Pirellulaceae bacterium]